MSLVSHSDCASNGAQPARKRASSLDSRRRHGSAGDAALSGLSHNARSARTEAIAAACASGRPQVDVAEEYGITPSRVSQICKNAKYRGAVLKAQKRTANAKHKRDLALVREYECGFTTEEIAARHNIPSATLYYRLSATGAFTARRCGNSQGMRFRVPAWVPVEHIERWRRIASLNGTDAADTCIRNMIAWEAR